MKPIRERSLAKALLSAALAVTLPSTPVAQAAARPGPKTTPRNQAPSAESFLKRASQQLLDAVARGDTVVWSRYLDPSCLYTDEEGGTATKAELLSQLRPLPKGYRGTIRLKHPQVLVTGETAVLTSDLDEELALYGQVLRTRFHLTSTWVKRPEGWKMIASQNAVLPSDHRAARVDPASFDAYVGTYGLAPDVTYAVARDGNRLYGQRKDRPKEELFPLGCDRFFRRGANRGEKLFVRDAQGRVTQMIDRRDNNDLVWRRTR
jgi:hypothetical protein